MCWLSELAGVFFLSFFSVALCNRAGAEQVSLQSSRPAIRGCVETNRALTVSQLESVCPAVV